MKRLPIKNILENKDVKLHSEIFENISAIIVKDMHSDWSRQHQFKSIKFIDNLNSRSEHLNVLKIFEGTLSINTKQCTRTENAFHSNVLCVLLGIKSIEP